VEVFFEILKNFRASDWNLANPNWTGRLRLVSKSDDVLEIRLEDKNTGIFLFF